MTVKVITGETGSTAQDGQWSMAESQTENNQHEHHLSFNLIKEKNIYIDMLLSLFV